MVRLDVADADARGLPANAADFDPERSHGRGLGIAAALATRLTTAPNAAGKTVTAEFNVTSWD
jgi:hypothetical protein